MIPSLFSFSPPPVRSMAAILPGAERAPPYR
jgi:hypothetical protein